MGGGGGVLRGSPLAMLAAQCNKLTTKSPPPLADAAVGKGAGFHPWKKCSGQSITSGSPEHTTPTSQPASPAQSSYTTSPPPAYGKYLVPFNISIQTPRVLKSNKYINSFKIFNPFMEELKVCSGPCLRQI